MKRKLFALSLLLSVFSFAQVEEENDSTAFEYDPIEIKEVLIQSQRKKLFADKAVYTFDKEALEKARYAKDLLATLPELDVDFINNTVKSTKGGTTLFLINGIEATDAQMRMIQPENVVRVEYFDIPPSRWANRADQVVNVVTRNPENGYSYGADALSAFNTGFLNATAYGNYTKGKHDFGLEYYISLRDYDDRQSSTSLKYRLNDSDYSTEDKEKDHFGYTFQNVGFRYTNVGEKYSFQSKLNVDILSYFSHANGINLFSINNVTSHHTTKGHNNRNYTKPSLDLYYSNKIGEKDELIFNAIGTHFKTKSYELAKEWNTADNSSVFDNEMNLEATQTSLVGEVAHIHTFGKNSLNSGYRFTSNQIENQLSNLLGNSNYEVTYLQHYLYSEFSGKSKKLMYRVGAGLTNINNKSAEVHENDWIFTLKVVLGYELSKNQSLRLTSSYQPTSPWSEALSSNVIQFAPNIVRRGNPYLIPQKEFTNSLNYSFNSKYFDFNVRAFYNHTKDAINQYFLYDADLNKFALTYDNVDYSSNYGVQFSGSIKPFGNDLLNMKVVLTPTKEKLKNKEGKELTNDYIESNFSLSSTYKNFTLYYQYNIPVYSLDGAFLNTNENNNHLFLKYKWNNFTFTTGMYWMGMPSEYKTKTLDTTYVNYKSITQIWNNQNMFVLGVSYDFSTGKNNNINRRLNNSTAPAATF